MPTALHPLPDDVDALKSLLTDQLVRDKQLQADKQATDQENKHLKVQVLTLTEQLNLALARRYAASSGKLSPDQISRFDEAELDSETELNAATGASAEAGDDEITVAAHQRKKCGRKPLPDHLPRVDVVHELAEVERRCDHDGRLPAEIGEVVSVQLDIIVLMYRDLDFVGTSADIDSETEELVLGRSKFVRDGIQSENATKLMVLTSCSIQIICYCCW